MRDVAALAGVSLKTVSRVITGTATVDPVLAAKVRRAAAQLNYLPNLTASSLRRGDGRSLMIGLMLGDVASPLSSGIYRSAESMARRRGFGVLVLAGSLDEDPGQERELASSILLRRADGLIIVPAGHDHSYLRHELDMGTALVFVDRPPRFLAADSVVSDNCDGAAAGVRHLIDHGHRRIAYLGGLTSVFTAQDRYRGYLDSMGEAGLCVDARHARHDLHSVTATEAAVTEILAGQNPPTALFAEHSLATIGVIRALRLAGLHRQVALVGFGDFPLADLLDPPVTVVAQDPGTIGAIAAELLFRRIDGDESSPEQHVVASHLIGRGSGEIPPP